MLRHRQVLPQSGKFAHVLRAGLNNLEPYYVVLDYLALGMCTLLQVQKAGCVIQVSIVHEQPVKVALATEIGTSHCVTEELYTRRRCHTLLARLESALIDLVYIEGPKLTWLHLVTPRIQHLGETSRDLGRVN